MAARKEDLIFDSTATCASLQKTQGALDQVHK